MTQFKMDISPVSDDEDGIAPHTPAYIANLLSRAGLQLRRAPGKRFGVFACKAFAAGSHILTEESAACSVVRQAPGSISSRADTTFSAVACSYCMSDDKPLMRCTACHVAHYCCKEHQAAHWPRHKSVCARFKKIQKAHMEDGPWKRHFSVISICAELLESFAANSDACSRPTQADIMFLCAGRASPAASAVISALSQMTDKNADSFLSPTGNVVAAALFPAAAMLNHSCEPCAVQSFQGCRLQLRALADISVGDEVTISYIDCINTTAQRKRKLQLDYGFSCLCPRCEPSASAASAGSWGLICTACGKTVEGALELREASSRQEAVIEPDDDSCRLEPSVDSRCFCDCAPCCCAISQQVHPVITSCSCGHSLLEIRTRLQRLLSSMIVWTPPKPAVATMALVSAVESVRSLLPRGSAIMLRLLDSCCLAILATLGSDSKALCEVGRMSWEAADLHAEIAARPSVSEVLMRCRAVKAAAAAGDTAHVLEWGSSGVKMAGKFLGDDCEAVRLMRTLVEQALSVNAGRGQWS